MKKFLAWLGAIVVVLVALVLVLPGFIGRSIEKSAPRVVAVLNAHWRQHLTLVSFERHWFQSQAVLQDNLGQKVQVSIYNGPVIWCSHQPTFVLASLTAHMSNKRAKSTQLTGHYNYLGMLKLRLKAKDMAMPVDNNRLQAAKVVVGLTLPSLKHPQDGEMMASMHNVRVHMHLGGEFQVKQAKLRFDLSQEGATTRYRIRQFHITDFTTNFPKDKVGVHVAKLKFDGLSATIAQSHELAKLSDTVHQAVFGKKVGSPGLNTRVLLAMQKQKKQLLADMLAQGLLFKLDGVLVKTPMGDISLSLQVNSPRLTQANPTWADVLVALRSQLHVSAQRLESKDATSQFLLSDLLLDSLHDAAGMHVNFMLGKLVAKSAKYNHQLNQLDLSVQANTNGKTSLSDVQFNGKLGDYCHATQCSHNLMLGLTMKQVRLSGEEFFAKLGVIEAKEASLRKGRIFWLKQYKSYPAGSWAQKDALQHLKRVQTQLQQLYLEAAELYIVPQSSFALQASGDTAWGAMKADATMSWPNAQGKLWLLNPAVHFQLQAAKTLVNHLLPQGLQSMLPGLVQGGFVTEQTEQYHTSGEFVNHGLKLNGKSFPG